MEYIIHIKFISFKEYAYGGKFFINIDKKYIKEFYINGVKNDEINFELEEEKDYDVEIFLNEDIEISYLFSNINNENARLSRYTRIYIKEIVLVNFSYVGKLGDRCQNKLTKVTLVNVKKLERTFDSCKNLKEVNIKGKTEEIGLYAFYNCTSLSSITLPSSLTSIGQDAFYNCTSLSSITLPSSLTSIGQDAFSCCSSLSSITLPSSIISIGQYAFYDCSSLSSINLPDSITSIGKGAFSYCTSLTLNRFQKRFMNSFTKIKKFLYMTDEEYKKCNIKFSEIHFLELNNIDLITESFELDKIKFIIMNKKDIYKNIYLYKYYLINEEKFLLKE